MGRSPLTGRVALAPDRTAAFRAVSTARRFALAHLGEQVTFRKTFVLNWAGQHLHRLLHGNSAAAGRGAGPVPLTTLPMPRTPSLSSCSPMSTDVEEKVAGPGPHRATAH